MKKYFATLLVLLALASACTQVRAKNNHPVETSVEAGGGDQVLTDNTLIDHFIIIGGHSTNYTFARDIMATSFTIVIGENRSADLSGIEQLQKTTLLRISLLDTRDVDFSPLRSLPNLQFLYLWGLTAIPDLSGIPSIIMLELKFGRLTSLNGIEKMPTLEHLVISENYMPLTDISALRHLKNLQSFHFFDGYHTIDFSVFADLPELKEVRIGGNGETDLIGIGQATSIEKLRLQSNTSKILDERSTYKNIEEIGKMIGLKELYIDESISSVEFLAGNVNLERLELIADKERSDYWEVLLPLDIRPLGNLTKLRYLAIRGFELENADVREGLPELEIFSTRLYDGDH